jgi:DNA-directed RNA polymerase specialized sigma24 family protein
MAVQDDIARLLDELVRLHALDLRRRSASQVDAILELSKAGLGPTRIAELLGTTAGTVNVALAKAKKRKPKKTNE